MRWQAFLWEAAAELNFEGQVSFPGYIARDAVPALPETFDAFCYVTSSALECCPLAIIEAMAARTLPIVAEGRGGIPEIVVDGENGLLANSMEQIGNHLRRLRDDGALRERLARGARATAERYSLARIRWRRIATCSPIWKHRRERAELSGTTSIDGERET